MFLRLLSPALKYIFGHTWSNGTEANADEQPRLPERCRCVPHSAQSHLQHTLNPG